MTNGIACFESEQRVLGSIFTNPEQFGLIDLSAQDFSTERHRRIFAAMKETYSRGDVIDRSTIGLLLKSKNQLESCGGLTYLAELDDAVAGMFSVDSHLSRVKDMSVRRRIATILHKSSEQLQNGSETTSQVTERVMLEMRGIEAETSIRSKLKNAGEIVADYGGINPFLSPQEFGVRSPWRKLNDLTGGFLPGQLIVVAARPGVGKTAVAMQVAEQAATNGAITAVFSLEMSSKELLVRMACASARVDSLMLRRGLLESDERSLVVRELTRLASIPLLIDDSPGITPSTLHTAIRKLSMQGPVGLVVVDYLQLMQTTGKIENRNQQIGEISRSLKLIAKEFNVPVIELSQLSRASDTEKREPKLSDLRDSGSIEQDADVVLFIHRADLKNPESKLIIAKQRNGPLGDIPLHFRGSVTRFDEVAYETDHHR